MFAVKILIKVCDPMFSVGDCDWLLIAELVLLLDLELRWSGGVKVKGGIRSQ